MYKGKTHSGTNRWHQGMKSEEIAKAFRSVGWVGGR